MAEEPHRHVLAAFDPEQQFTVQQHLRRLADAAEWLQRELQAERERPATRSQAAMIEDTLREVVETLIDGHRWLDAVGPIGRGQDAAEVARLLASIRSIRSAAQR
jgi:hypothetical protein